MGYLLEMRQKIKDVFRIAHVHGHQKIVVAARVEKLPVRKVAALFREVLLEDEEDQGAFSSVVFALPSGDLSARTFLSFREEFKPGVNRPEWKAGKHLLTQSPKPNEQVCLAVDLEKQRLTPADRGGFGQFRGTKASAQGL